MNASMLWGGAKQKKENLEGWPKLNLEKKGNKSLSLTIPSRRIRTDPNIALEGLKKAPNWLFECEGDIKPSLLRSCDLRSREVRYP